MQRILGLGHRGNPQLISIPVGRPIERVNVDIMELPQTKLEHRYMTGFEDNITKWLDVYPVENQTSENISHLQVDIICRHGILVELLSDRLEEPICSLI